MNKALYLSAAEVTTICEALSFAADRVKESRGDIQVFTTTADPDVQVSMADVAIGIADKLSMINGTDHAIIDDDVLEAARVLVANNTDRCAEYMDNSELLQTITCLRGLQEQ